jgi:hypothetical protein
MVSQKFLLGGLSQDQFLKEYWQKKPLPVRQALPGFGDWLDRDGQGSAVGLEESKRKFGWTRTDFDDFAGQ